MRCLALILLVSVCLGCGPIKNLDPNWCVGDSPCRFFNAPHRPWVEQAPVPPPPRDYDIFTAYETGPSPRGTVPTVPRGQGSGLYAHLSAKPLEVARYSYKDSSNDGQEPKQEKVEKVNEPSRRTLSRLAVLAGVEVQLEAVSLSFVSSCEKARTSRHHSRRVPRTDSEGRFRAQAPYGTPAPSPCVRPSPGRGANTGAS